MQRKYPWVARRQCFAIDTYSDWEIFFLTIEFYPILWAPNHFVYNVKIRIIALRILRIVNGLSMDIYFAANFLPWYDMVTTNFNLTKVARAKSQILIQNTWKFNQIYQSIETMVLFLSGISQNHKILPLLWLFWKE